MRHFFTITWFDRKDTVTKRAMRHLFCWLACLCFMAMPTMADKYFTIGDYRYFETDSIQKNVSVFSNSIDLEEIVIPEKVEYEGIEYNVTSIYPQAYFNHTEIKSVVIPSSVKTMNIKLLKVAQI
ncbi:MAG: leucine-rich repeat domain-containing protein [Paludibacteraceae bacterium]|nr:leucine-rich repeat domain-containing protein [Paludibacteraceae bacterium]